MPSEIKKATQLEEGSATFQAEEKVILLLDFSWSMNFYMPYSDAAKFYTETQRSFHDLKAFIKDTKKLPIRSRISTLLESTTRYRRINVYGSPSAYYRSVDAFPFSKRIALVRSVISFIKQRIYSLGDVNMDTDLNLGIMLFYGDSINSLVNPFDSSLRTVLDAVESLLSYKADEGTPMHKAILGAVDLAKMNCLLHEDALYRFILVSDGEPDRRTASLEAASKAYNEYGFIIDTICVGSIEHGSDPDFLKRLADIAGGEFTQVNNTCQMIECFNKLEEDHQLLLSNGVLLLPDHIENKQQTKQQIK